MSPTVWIPAGEYTDIRYEKSAEEGGSSGIAKVTINRPEVRNAFRPQTIVEIGRALEDAREDTEVGVIVLTGEGPLAFCSGGDQRVRGDSGYLSEPLAGEAEPLAGEAEPLAGEAEPLAGEAEPLAGEAEPLAGEAEPLAGEPEPLAGEPEPLAGEPEPLAGEAEPLAGEAEPLAGEAQDAAGKSGVGRFHVTDLHIQIRRLPKPVVAMVAGYAIGGGHVLHLVCDLTIAADNARFGQTGPKVGSFDGGFGAGLLANLVGPKKAKEIWFLCRQYSAQEALAMGLVNTVVPLERLEEETVQWCREMLALSPFSLRLLKASFNAAEDGLSGVQQLAHDANLLFYMSEEAQEGREAYKQKRTPDFSRFPRRA